MVYYFVNAVDNCEAVLFEVLANCLFVHCRIAGEMPKAFIILDDVVQHTLTNLHSIHKSLLFWQAKAEV